MLRDQEIAEIQRLAKRERITVSEWVRRALREARRQKPVTQTESKLKAIRRAAEYSFPTGEIQQILHEIEQGYRS